MGARSAHDLDGGQDSPPVPDRPTGEGAAPLLVATAVTALFVPGDRPDRYRKAAGSGADVVIVDLEDAVAADAKPAALQAALAALSSQADRPLRALVRVNATDAPTHATEIQALVELLRQPGHGLLGVMVPKAESPSLVADLAALLTAAAGPLALVPLVESAAGISCALELARVPGVTRLALGAVDLMLDLDAELDGHGHSPVLDHCRARLVVASRAAGIAAPLDSPSTAISDLHAVERSAQVGRAFGFGGKLCIHPAQLTPVTAGFRPSEQEVTWARSIVLAGASAVQVDGQMVDKPIVDRARRILRRADGDQQAASR